MTAQLPLLAAPDVAGSSSDQDLPATHNVTSGPSQGEGDGPDVATLSAVEGGAAASVSCVGTDVAPEPQPVVIGLDLSLSGTGMSDGTRTWLIRSAGKQDDDLASRAQRLRKIRAEVVMHCDGADLVVIEGPSYGTNSGHMHDRSGLWWLVVQALAHRGIGVAEVPPSTLKKYATGKGNGPKGAVIEAAARRFPDVVIGGDDNRADAQWLHAMGVDHLAAVSVVPVAQRVALEAVRWPAVAAAS